jgi:hypothetical protein
MTFVAMQSTSASAPSFSAPAWLRSLYVIAGRLREAWPALRATSSFHILTRALAVATLLSVIAVIALIAQPDEMFRPAEKTARPARVKVAATPFMTLSRQGDDFPLDSDFSLEQAALTWSHRIGAGGEADSPETMRFGPVRVSRSIVEHVVQAAKTTETDPALLMAIADKESNFRASVKASTSSASGLFQFIDSTWFKALKAFGWRYGRAEEAKAIGGEEAQPRVSPEKRAQILNLRNDPYLSAALAAEMLKKDGARIAEKLGRALTAGETYLIHFLGPDDAARFMQKMDDEPDASAARLLPRPARANKPIFYAQEGRGMKDKTVGEVHEAFETMMGKRTSRYEDVEQRLPRGAMAYSETAGQISRAGSLEPAAEQSATEPLAAKRTMAKRAIARASIASSAPPRRTRPCRDCRASPRERHVAAPHSQKRKLPDRRHR